MPSFNTQVDTLVCHYFPAMVKAHLSTGNSHDIQPQQGHELELDKLDRGSE